MTLRPKRGPFDKCNLWPWRYWMTIGVGVLATTAEGRKNQIVPNAVVLIADTMGSFGDVDSHARLHKVMTLPEVGLYATVAGEVDKGAELVPVIANFLSLVPKLQRTYGSILQALAAACFAYKGNKFTLTELPRLRLPPEVFDPRKTSPEISAIVQDAWDKFDIGCDLILAVFDGTGRAHLFQITGAGHEISNVSFPGFAAIGVGAENALFWLSRRQHTMGIPLVCSAYHAYEAKLMAEGSAHVNKHLDIIVATNDDHWVCTTHAKLTAEKEHPEINIAAMKKLFKKFGPKDTVTLTKP